MIGNSTVAITGSPLKEDPIGRRQLRPTRLRAEHREFVSKYDDLELLEVLRARTQQDELEQAAERQVAERPEQEPTPRIQGTDARLYDRHTPRRTGTELTHPTGEDRSTKPFR